MNMLLAGLRGFITGAGTGIGRAIALEMVREGADLYITDLDLEAAQRVANEARTLRAEAHVWADQLDVRNAVNVTARIEDAANRLGGLEMAVNNAGVSTMARVVDLTEADWDFNMDVNAKGIFLCCQAEVRHFLLQGRGGSIVNTASMAGKKAAPLLAHYSASKFAVIGFTQALAGTRSYLGSGTSWHHTRRGTRRLRPRHPPGKTGGTRRCRSRRRLSTQ